MDLASLRQYRIGPFPIFDTALAYVGILIISPLLTWLFSKIHVRIPWYSWLWFTVPLSVVFHILFHVNSPLMKMLFDLKTAIPVVIVLIVMMFMGGRSIKKI